MYGCFKANLLAVCGNSHPLSLSRNLGALAVGLGCFPLGNESYHPLPHCRETCQWHSEFDRGWYPIRALAQSVLYLHDTIITTLHLNAFRRERAITKFDWPFTPYHSSSARFSTQVGSVLHNILLLLQPGHGKITWFRVYPMLLNALFRLGFPTAPSL